MSANMNICTVQYVLVICVCSIFLVGCGRTIHSYSPQKFPEYKVEVDKNYFVGEKLYATTGGQLLFNKAYSVTLSNDAVISASQDFSIVLDTTYYISKENRLPVYGVVKKDKDVFTVAVLDIPMRGRTGLLFDKDMRFSGKTIHLENGIIPRPVATISPQSTQFALLQKEEKNLDPASCNFELVYTGCTNDLLSFMYREYTGEDLVKEGSTQYLSYPRDAQRVRFRNIVLDIHQASAEGVSYTVVADGLPEQN